MKNLLKHWLAGAIGALLAITAGLFLFFFTFGDGLTRLSYDLPFLKRPIVTPNDVALVILDEYSHDVLQQPKNKPWDRSIHGKLVDQLTKAGARAIVFDILFADPAPSEREDAAFAKAIQSHGNVVLAANYSLIESAAGPMESIEKPVELLDKNSAGWGIVTLPLGSDMAVRQACPANEEIPSLAWAAAKAVGADVTKKASDSPANCWLNYYGPPGVFATARYHQALETNQLPANFFRDKVVFVGASLSAGFSGAEKDSFGTAYSWITRKFAPGVEVHATAFRNLLHQEWLGRSSPIVEVGLLVLVGVVFGFGLLPLRPWLAPTIAVAAIISVAAVAWVLFRFQLVWFAWLIPVVQIAIALAWALTYNSFRAYVDKQILQRSLDFHLSPRRVEQLLKRPELLKPYGEKQEVSLLFSDIANFSTICERTLPDKLFQQLNKYFGETIGCVHETDGTIMQLIGDAIFAVWNAPEQQPDHQERACRAALLLKGKLVKFDAANESFPMQTRVGLHVGAVSVGNLGSSDRFDFTAIGTNVNLASRLEALNKHLGTDILLSEEMFEAVHEKFVGRFIGHFRLKGFDRVIGVCELIADKSAAAENEARLKTFADGLRKFKRSEFDDAEAAFHCVLKTHPEDGPTKFYLKLIEQFRVKSPGAGWFGEIDMDQK